MMTRQEIVLEGFQDRPAGRRKMLMSGQTGAGQMVTVKMSAAEMLDREFLEIRCRLLDVAAAMDRIERGRDFAAVDNEPRLDAIRRAMQVLLETGPDRAAKVQMIFSDEYDPGWRSAK